MEALAKLGIDPWGLLIYLVNFGILWAALAYLVFPKLIRAVDQRRKLIADNLETAERLQAELETTVAQAEKQKEAVQKALLEERTQMEAYFTRQRAELLRKSEEERTKLLDEAHALIREEKKRLISQTEAQMLAMMQRVLIRILGERVDPDDVAASVSQVWNETKREVIK